MRLLVEIACALGLVCALSGCEVQNAAGRRLDEPTGPSGVVGPSGGTVTSANVKLTVPEGAVDSDVVITVAQSTGAAPPAGYVAASPIYTFSPDGLVFKKPVRVEIPLPGDGAGKTIVWVSGARAEELPSSIAGGAMTAEVMHFSSGFIGSRQRCDIGSWDHDGIGTSCKPWSTCVAGQHVANTPSGVEDRACAGCASGTFSRTENEASCSAWTTCAPGTFVSRAGTAVADQECSPCPSGTHSQSANQSSCVATGSCEAGTEQTAAATPTSAAVCTACGAGTHCPGGTTPKQSCPNGTWDHDGNAATACVGWTSCSAGQSVSVTGSATTDRACVACPSGSFSETADASSCSAWRSCAPGTFVSQGGSATADRTCAACPPDTYSSQPDQSFCVPNGTCEAGTVETTPATATSAAGCAACEPGTYCSGGREPKKACESGLWDHDSNAATACTPWTTCTPGQHVVATGTTTTDRSCAACESGSFSSSANTPTCTSWRDCATGTYVTAGGSTTADRQCAACPPDTYSSSPNQSSCLPVEACAAGTEQTASGSPPVCSACDAGTYCAGGTAPKEPCPVGTWDDDASSATACVAWTNCAAGYRVASAGSTTTDRSCAACAGGTYSTSVNAPSCTAWSDCAAGRYVSAPPSATADRQCTSCPAGETSTSTNATSCTIVAAAEVVAGKWHSCARFNDGSVRCWGNNADGQLGDGTRNGAFKPVSVVGLSGVVQLAAGERHTCALLADRTVRCWGANMGITPQEGGRHLTPTRVEGLADIREVSAGSSNTCAVDQAGAVFCSGFSAPMITSKTPERVPGVSGAVTVKAAYEVTCAGLANEMKCWGNNSSGQLGNGTTSTSEGPVTVSGLSGSPLALAPGNTHTCVSVAGVAKCWGSNFNGELGNPDSPSTQYRTTPLDVAGLSGVTVTQLSSSVSTTEFTCARLNDETARCWGSNSSGQLGTGTKGGYAGAPVAVGGLTGVTAVAAGTLHTCASLKDGTIRCWGDNTAGQLGDGTTTERLTPVVVVW